MSVMTAGARRGNASSPHAGHRRARSPGAGSVGVPQRPQKRRGAIPLDQLHGSPGEGPAEVVDPSVEAHERHEAVDDHVGNAVAVEVDRPAGGAVEHPQHLARRAGCDVVGMLVQHADLALLDDDRDGARPVVGQVEHRHEAGLGHVSTPPGSTRSVASWSDRTTATTPAAMSRPAGHAAAGRRLAERDAGDDRRAEDLEQDRHGHSGGADAAQHVVHEGVAEQLCPQDQPADREPRVPVVAGERLSGRDAERQQQDGRGRVAGQRVGDGRHVPADIGADRHVGGRQASRPPARAGRRRAPRGRSRGRLR